MKKAIFFLILCICPCVFAGPQARTLLDQSVVVVRSDSKDFHFRIPDELEGEWVIRGMYQTKGGFNDDITFLALTQENYVRWFSHYKFQAIVDDEKKKDGTFKFAVTPGGTYYFVLYNFFSTISNKHVKLKIELAPKE